MSNAAQLLREYDSRARQQGLLVECPSFGNYNADLAIVSEYPGETEAQMKMPFVGPAGRLLFSVLGKYDITRNVPWTTNVYRRRVLTNAEKAALPRHETSMWEGLLLWELLQLPNLKHILVLGNTPLHALTGESGIEKWRGSVMKWRLRAHGCADKEVTLIFANNPAAVLREPQKELIFHADMHRLHIVRTGKWQEHKIEARINPSPTEALEWIERMHDERLPVSLDIETMSNETACIGLTNNPHVGMCINFRGISNNRWSTRDEREVRKRIQRLVGDVHTRIVAQNGGFDTYWLWYKDRIQVHKVWFDTLLAHHTLYPSLPHDLGFLTAQYTTHPFYKDDKDLWHEGHDIDAFWNYNVKDICITLAVQRRIHGELQEQHLEQFFFNHVMRLQPHLVRMTVGGVLNDLTLKERIIEEVGADVAAKEKHFKRLVAEALNDPHADINPNSNKQLGDLLFRHLKLVGRGGSTDADNRARMMLHPRTPQRAKDILLALDAFKEDHKFFSTYAKSEIGADGRFRCEYRQFGTQKAPGRLSSSALLSGEGGNLQNQPDRAKQMFVADPGKRFLYFDLSQAEARVVAYKWHVKGLIDNFEAVARNAALDVHRANAARIFKVSYESIPPFDRWELGKNTDDPKLAGKPTRRFLGKRCVHGLNYRMGPDKLAETCQIPFSMAAEAYAAYHQAFPEIARAWERTTKEVYKTRELWNLLGRRLRFLGRLPSAGANEGTDEAKVLDSIVAFVPQSTIGDKVCEAIYLIEDDPDWPHDEARIVLNVHDALIALVPDDDDMAMHCARVMKRHAEKPLFIDGGSIVIPADFAWSYPTEWSAEKQTWVSGMGLHRWSNMEKIKVAA